MATAISFSKIQGKYRGRFTAQGDFGIKVKGGGAMVYVGFDMESGTGDYAPVEGSSGPGDVYQRQFQSLVYPVYVEVVCDEMPSSGKWFNV